MTAQSSTGMSSTHTTDSPTKSVEGHDEQPTIRYAEDKPEVEDPYVWTKLDLIVLPVVTVMYFLSSLVSTPTLGILLIPHAHSHFFLLRTALTSQTQPSPAFS